jgi:hypothetical protein
MLPPGDYDYVTKHEVLLVGGLGAHFTLLQCNVQVHLRMAFVDHSCNAHVHMASVDGVAAVSFCV